jgi:hypothetical protein
VRPRASTSVSEGGEDNHWGDSTDRVVAGIWLLFLGGIVAIVIRKVMRYERHRDTSERGH